MTCTERERDIEYQIVIDRKCVIGHKMIEIGGDRDMKCKDVLRWITAFLIDEWNETNHNLSKILSVTRVILPKYVSALGSPNIIMAQILKGHTATNHIHIGDWLCSKRIVSEK